MQPKGKQNKQKKQHKLPPWRLTGILSHPLDSKQMQPLGLSENEGLQCYALGMLLPASFLIFSGSGLNAWKLAT